MVQPNRDAEGVRLDIEGLELQPERSHGRDRRRARTRSRSLPKLRIGDPRRFVQPRKYIKLPTTFKEFEKWEGRTGIKNRGTRLHAERKRD